MTFSTTSTVG